MPFVNRKEGYPVSSAETGAVEGNGEAAGCESQKLQPSAKDRSIIRQTAWKIVGPAMANWAGTPDSWFDKCVEMRAKVERDMLDA